MLPLVALLSMAAPPQDAGAEDAPSEAASADATRPPGVDVILVGTGDDRAAVKEVLVELLGRVDVEVTWQERDVLDVQTVVRSLDVSAQPQLLATVVVDLQAATGLVIVLDAPGDRILARRIALDGGVDEIAREEIGAITAESVDALRAGGTIGVARREVLPPAQPDPPDPPIPPPSPAATPAPAVPVRAATPPPSPPRWPDTVAILASYRLVAWSRAEVSHRAGASLLLLDRGRRVAPRLELGAGAWLPVQVGDDAQGIRVVGATSRAVAGLDVRIARATTFVATAGLGLDALAVRSRAAADARWVAVPTLDARVGLSWWLRPGIALGVGAVAIVDLVDVRILATEDDRVLFDPWRVWPGLELSLGGFVSLIDRTRRPPPRT